MKELTHRTKSTQTAVGLIALTGICYAAKPSQRATVPKSVAAPDAPPPFANITEPIGVAASATDLFATELETQNIDTIDCLGNVSVLATIPVVVTGGHENYIAIAPAQSVAAGFTPRDIFVTQGANIYKISGGVINFFTAITCDQPDHTGITFDHEGTFGN